MNVTPRIPTVAELREFFDRPGMLERRGDRLWATEQGRAELEELLRELGLGWRVGVEHGRFVIEDDGGDLHYLGPAAAHNG